MKKNNVLIGAAFLMATSAIGPGFLTQTAKFTIDFGSSFAFAILVSILIDIGAQLNIWRVIAISELPTPQIADKILRGSGAVLSALIVLGGVAFNMGNIAGAGLGLEAFLDMPVWVGAIVSSAIAVVIFWVKNAGLAADAFAKYLGFLMIGLTIYVVFQAKPPVGTAIHHAFFPEKISWAAIVTLVGGTVGGYISFSGGHRLLQEGITGKAHLAQVSRSAIMGIVVASVMRILLFLAALGVVVSGVTLQANKNPAAEIFRTAAGTIGYRLFGIVMWSAAITSVVGSAYTSVSFLSFIKNDREKRLATLIFIVFSLILFLILGKPVKILIGAGILNGIILPFSLSLMLLAARRLASEKNYHHPLWLTIFGWLIVLAMLAMSVYTAVIDVPKLMG